MGVSIPQVVTETKASGAQVIDGSLKFDASKTQYLTRTPGSAGNQRTWTWSGWLKRAGSSATNKHPFYGAYGGSNETSTMLAYDNSTDDAIRFEDDFINGDLAGKTPGVFRDFSGWYHVVISLDTTQSSVTDGLKIYVNGTQQTGLTNTIWNQNHNSNINSTVAQYIGSDTTAANRFFDGGMSQVYLIDGQALGPESFGYTDPLTNTWRPKKFDIRAEVSKNPNNGTVWSTAGTITNDDTENSHGISKAFDGSLDNTAQHYWFADNGTTSRYTFPSVIRGTKFELYMAVSLATTNFSVNGQSSSNVSGAFTDQWKDVTDAVTASGLGGLSYIDISYSSGNYSQYIFAIRVDGYILIDGAQNNSFYLPMDGNSPIGEDKSGNGNDWTPVNFGGSVALDNPQVSGARPILNTDGGGKTARPGVFGSEENQFVTVTVASKTGGGNAYFFGGVERDSLASLRGTTVTFDTTDSTNNSHPFKLSSTNADSSGGTEYTDGVAYYINGSVVSGSDYVTNYSSGAASGFRGIKWTVPHNVSTTYYYCTVHNGMGENGRLTSTTDETKADPYAWKNFLALPLVGSDDDVSNSVNSGSTAKVATNSSVDVSSVQSNFYSGSHYWNANTDSLLYAQQGNELVFGTNDFTIEFWFYDDNGHNGTGNRCVLFDNRRGGNVQGDPPQLVGWVDSHNEINLYYANGSEINITVGTTVGKWWHYAAVRSGGTTKLYIDGVEVGSASDTTNYPNNGIALGSGTDSGYSWSGYIQDFRVYNGVAKYTSDFVVPATSPDVLPDTPSGVSGGSKLAKVINGSVAFDGSGDYLSVADSSDLTVGTNPFTLEFYAYKTAAGEDFFCGSYDSSGTTASLSYAVQTGGSSPTNSLVAHVAEGGSATSVNSGVDFVLNKWVHVAFVRDGNTLRLFQDGIQMSTAAFSGTVNDASNAFEIGRAGFSGKDFPGYISNFRFVNGTALYTANFNPPTRTLTNVTNTKLLCCQSNTLAGSAAVVPGASGINDGTPWSEFVTIPEGRTGTNYNDDASNWFDGDTSTSASLYSGNMVSPYSPTTVVFTPPSPITVSTGVRVYMAVDRGQTILINGTQTNASVSAGWNDTGFTGTLTSLTLGPTNAGSSSNPSALEIDGVILKNLVLPKGNAAATNFNPFNTDIKTVRGQETGYTTWNPLDIQGLDAGDLKDGNLSITHSAGNWLAVRANKFVSSGKWYYEVKVGNNQYTTFGVGSVDYNLVPTSNDWCNVANVYGFYPYNGKVYDAATGRDYATADTSAAGNVYGIAIDMDNKSLRFYENGRDLGVAFDSTTATNFVNKESVAPMAWLYNQSGTDDYNFGQKPFKFPPPAGFQPLNDANVRPSTIVARPDQYVDVRSGLTAQFTISDLDFETNLVIAKSSSHDEYWIWADSVRGFIGGLRSNGTDVEGSGLAIANVNSNGYQSDSNWFTTSRTYVTYSFKAGGSKNTFNVDDVGYASAAAAGITGLDGTGEMTTAKFLGCSIGTKQGFSIIKYRGLGGGNVKVPHGLSQTPNMVIVKNLDSSVDWAITHSGLPGNRSLRFTTASTDTSGFLGLNKGGLASTYFTINFTDTNLKYVNASNEDYVAYIWHDVPGLQKFGSYTGNGSADGTFVETGFRPTLLWIKNTTTNGELWCAHDNKRDPFNPAKQRLELNGSGEQDATQDARIKDFLSNGFKIRGTSGEQNTSGDNYIYCAWAEAPEFNLYGAQSNAR